MKTKKIKNLKPIDCVADLKYRCPNCGLDHWVSLKEAKTTGFIIVCDCDTLLKVKPIKSVNITYLEEAKQQVNTSSLENTRPLQKTDEKIIKQACSVLGNYGFTPQESMQMALKHTDKELFTDAKLLITKILSNLENVT